MPQPPCGTSMTSLASIAVFVGMALSAPASFAQEFKVSSEYKQCTNEVTPGETEGRSFAACDRAELKRQDLTLNEVYQQLKSQLTRDQPEALTRGQRAWLRQREGWCQFEKTLGGFPEQNYSWCVLESTLRQIETLRLSIRRVV